MVTLIKPEEITEGWSRDMSEHPVVSVLMPMRNGRPFVLNAVQSVLAERSVTLEIIVINDRSNDGSPKILRDLNDPRIRVIDSVGEGIANAFNTGLAAARGRFIARCDSDDIYPNDRLNDQVKFLESHPDIGAVCGAFAIMSPQGSILSDLESGPVAESINRELCAGIVRTHYCCFLVRKEILDNLKGCRPFFRTGEDIDLQLRLGEACAVWYQPKRRYLYRLHADSVTHQLGGMLTGHYDWVARHLQSQRRNGAGDDLDRNIMPPVPNLLAPEQSPLAKQIQGILLGTAWQQHSRGHKLRSILTGLRAGVSRPSDLAIWRSVAALVLKKSGQPLPPAYVQAFPHVHPVPTPTPNTLTPSNH
ncbi:MAG TPA: glycosyltransferase family 2 protein [Tepidisphaeraceae bacterium]